MKIIDKIDGKTKHKLAMNIWGLSEPHFMESCCDSNDGAPHPQFLGLNLRSNSFQINLQNYCI